MMEGASASSQSFNSSGIQIYFIDKYILFKVYFMVRNRLRYNFFLKKVPYMQPSLYFPPESIPSAHIGMHSCSHFFFN